MIQFCIYCAVSGPKWSQLTSYICIFPVLNSHIVPFGTFHPEEWIEEVMCIASFSLKFHYLYVKSCV